MIASFVSASGGGFAGKFSNNSTCLSCDLSAIKKRGSVNFRRLPPCTTLLKRYFPINVSTFCGAVLACASIAVADCIRIWSLVYSVVSEAKSTSWICDWAEV